MNGLVVLAPNMFVVRGTTLVRDPDGRVTVINPGNPFSDRDLRELEKIGQVKFLCWLGDVAFESEWKRQFPSAARVDHVPGASAIGEGLLFFPQHRRTLIVGNPVLVRTTWLGKLSIASSFALDPENVVLPNGQVVSGIFLELEQPRPGSSSVMQLVWILIFCFDVAALYYLWATWQT